MKKTSTRKPDQKSKATIPQMKVLRAIYSHINFYGIPPIYDEIAKDSGYSKRNVRRIIDILIRKGIVARASGRYRNLYLTDYGHIEARKRTK